MKVSTCIREILYCNINIEYNNIIKKSFYLDIFIN